MAYSAPTSDFITSTLNGAIAAGDATITIGTGLDLPATNGILQIDYDSSTALGSDNGPETISYATYTSGTGALGGCTRGLNGTTGVAHANGAKVQAGVSVTYFNSQGIKIEAIYNPYKISAYRNAAWNTPNNTWAKVTLDTENYDTNSNFATGTYTVPVTGYYHFDGHVLTSAASTGLEAAIYKGGASVLRGTYLVTASGLQGSSVSGDLYLTAGDTIELYCYAAAAVAGATGSGVTYLTGHLIST